MRMPLSPFEIAFSIAVIWVAVSPSSLPAAVVRVMPSLSADSLAPLAIATKNGFVEVFVIRVTPIEPVTAPEPDAAVEPAGALELVDVELGLLPVVLQAANRMAAVAITARPLIRAPRIDWSTWISSDVLRCLASMSRWLTTLSAGYSAMSRSCQAARLNCSLRCASRACSIRRCPK